MTILFSCLCYQLLTAQICPPNIDFETGTFSGWTCYLGSTAAVNGENVITISPSSPTPNRQTMYSYAANAGELDEYGGFPVVCPNGSGYSIRLGNNLPGTQAEGVSYQFKIPANQNVFSLIYHYAVVFQDPNHRPEEQPRMEIEVKNVTDNTIITCSSFTFIPYGTLLPGFFTSPNPRGDTPVWCKNWSAVSVNLDGMAGKTIRLFFKTADCTFRRHFGYAYIDVNSECTDEFVGAKYCPDDTAVNVTAPYGYQDYTWYNSSFSNVLGSEQTIRFAPPPPVGTTVGVEVVPYNGYGCLDTLYARLVDTLTITANAGRDTISCNHSPVVIGANSKPGLVYSWTPAAGLSDPKIANPLATPDVTTSYVVATRHDGGGCLNMDTVVVKASIIRDSLQLLGKAVYCLGSGDSTILLVQPTDNIQWFKDGIALNGADQSAYRVTKSGTYYAILSNNDGCSVTTDQQEVIIDRARAGITYPIQYAVIDLPTTLQARDFGSSALWSPISFLDNAASYAPIFRGSAEQLYTVEIKTTTGCVTVDTQMVKIVSHADIYVPSAFTPNDDEKNDILRPTLMGIKELHYFRVYNRWGQLMFDTKTNYAGWDGKYKGSPQSTQVFVWIVEGVGVDGRVYTKKGTTTLIR
ncbi:MAG TPA: T9SS type B sorting domain-containing protein [Chitinophagaceae bacterium]|nr:T9SS type B sorting domain-containing protein [Chitinophagaceae bacterium]